ncbi:MAG: hypothetical protein EU551_01685 [Promethearchaeota archaeon]|nr:MAG: hypothetical protein EU551_01685 [Candidatus Lokiarchaeota archaeon]
MSDDEDKDLFDDALDALDEISVEKPEKVGLPKEEKPTPQPQQETAAFQPPFPYAPALNDPSIKYDENSVRYLIDTNNYKKAIDSMINILRTDNKRVDKNIVAELIIRMVESGKKEYIRRLLPYLTIPATSDDPVLKMSINKAMLYLTTEYEQVINKLKNEIRMIADAIYDQYNTTYIPMTDLVYNIGTSIELIFAVLELMIKNKEINGKIDIAKNIFEYEPKGVLYRCPHCGKEVDLNAESCPYCWADIKKCGICFRFIKQKELVTCPFCNQAFHEKHLVEWVRKSGACPVCQNKLTQTEVATVLCCVCGREIKKGEKDIVECPHCKAPAHKDHWKEYMDVYDTCPECDKKIK